MDKGMKKMFESWFSAYIMNSLNNRGGKCNLNDIRTAEQIIGDIKELVKVKGFIYALCTILLKDLLFDPEKLHEIDHYSRLNRNEISLLLGFIIQNKIDFSTPGTPRDFTEMLQATYGLMEELHRLLNNPAVMKLQEIFESGQKKEDKVFWDSGDMFIEPIFYSGDGVYDFQYLDYLDRKYKYDKEWLLKNKSFDIEESIIIVQKIKNILQEKINNRKKNKANFMKSPYKEIMNLFVIRKSDLGDESAIDSFLENFSLIPCKDINPQFQGFGDYNLFNAKPIIQLDEERYFIPIIYSVSEAVYESPFYWMNKDESYKKNLSKNRGDVGEEITFDILSQVFSEGRIFKSVKIATQKGRNATDIDVLCILGNKALCVQVKSKKLTLLSRTGNDNQLNKDFQGAIQDAYKQGLVSREKILGGKAKFFDENNKEIHFTEDIDEVYIMGITTENYPSLTHQTQVKLDKKDDDSFPLFTTIFDLELMAHYLSDPYDFLYYIRQRTSLIDYFKANSEIDFLGYHLVEKLCKIPKNDSKLIPNKYAQMIDRNYCPLKAGIKVSDEGDAIKSRWGNRDFKKLCEKLKSSDLPQITDIIFHLLDLSGDTRKLLVDQIIITKQKTTTDRKNHDFTMEPDERDGGMKFGITYISSSNNDLSLLRDKLLAFCMAKKYRFRSGAWIGFVSIKNSNEIIDTVVFNNEKWEYNEELEKLSNMMFGERKNNI
jgi:Nuclease-related domain